MIVENTVELDNAVLEFYQNGTVYINRPDRRTSLSSEEVEAIADYSR